MINRAPSGRLSHWQKRATAKPPMARKPAVVVPKRKRKLVLPPDPKQDIPPDYTWYALEVLPKQEFKVANWLKSQGFAVIVPVETRFRLVKGATPANRGAGRKAKKEPYQIPVIPRLVVIGSWGPIPWFVVLNDRQHRAKVITMAGVPLKLRRNDAERVRDISEIIRRQAEPKPLSVGGKAVVVAPGMMVPAGRTVEVHQLPKGRYAYILGCFDIAPEKIVKIEKDKLEAVA